MTQLVPVFVEFVTERKGSASPVELSKELALLELATMYGGMNGSGVEVHFWFTTEAAVSAV